MVLGYLTVFRGGHSMAELPPCLQFSMLRRRLFQSGYWSSFRLQLSSVSFQFFLQFFSPPSSLASLPLNQHLLYTFHSWQSRSNTAKEHSVEAASHWHNSSSSWPMPALPSSSDSLIPTFWDLALSSTKHEQPSIVQALIIQRKIGI